MNYPCYPITKPKDAWVQIGDRRVKLPRPKWKIHTWGKNVECSFHVDARTPSRAVIHLQAETHWSSPVQIYLDMQRYGGKDLMESPWLPIEVNWSSGGCNKGFTAPQVAETMAELWKVAHRITRNLQNEVFYWAAHQVTK